MGNEYQLGRGVRAGSSTDVLNNDIAAFGVGSTGTQMQMNFGTLGTPYYLGTVNILASNTVAKTMGANTATAGIVQLNGTGANNLILSNASSSLFTLAPLAGGSGTGMSLRLSTANSTIDGTGGITISANITGAGTNAITKTGTGALTLSGANTFTGGVTLNAGTLSLGNNTALGTGGLTVGAVGTAISVTGTAAAFANNISLTNTAGRVTFGTPSISSTTLSGTISGGAANTGIATTTGTEWFFQGGAGGQNTGALTINGNNTGWQGTLNVQRGPLILGNANAAGTTVIRLDSNNPPAGALQLAGNFTIGNSLYLNSGAAQNIGGGSGLSAGIGGVVASNEALGFTKVGAGTLSLTGANTYSGSTVVSAGTLQIGSGGTIGNLGTGAVTNNATLAFNRSDAITVANVIGGSGVVNQVGSGTTTLNAANTFTGALNANAGTLALGCTGTLATNTININITGGVFDVSAVSGGYTLATGRTLTAGRATAATDITGDFTLAGNLSLGGSAFRTATFANNLTLNSGTIGFDFSSALTAGGGVNDLVAVGGNLILNGTSTLNITQPVIGLASGNYTLFSYGGSLTGNASNLTIGGASSGTTRQVFTIDTATSGSVLLNVSGSPASLIWTGTNNSNWDLITTTNNFSGAADNRFYNLDTVAFDDTATTGTVALAGSLAPTSVTVNNSSLNYTFSGTGAIGGTASLTKSGSGTLEIVNENTYSGGTTINGGTLQLGTGGITGSIAGNVTNNGALAFNRSDAVTFGGAISGTGNLTKAGAGTTTLTGANTYAGNTTISGGTLQVGNGGTTGTLGTGDVTNNASLVFNRSNAITAANIINGTGSVTKLGASSLTLSGANSFSGGFTQTAGAVTITNASALGTGTYTIASGAASGATGTINAAALTVNTSVSVILANAIVLPAPAGATTYTVLKASGGVLDFTGIISGGGANATLHFNAGTSGDSTTVYQLSGNNTFTVANININRGVLSVNHVNGLGAGTNRVTLDSNANNVIGNLSFNVSGSFANPLTITTASAYPVGVTAGNTATLTGLITANSNFVKLDAGTLNLTGDNGYTTQTLVNTGTLNVNGNQSAATGAVTVANGATLSGSGTVGGSTTVQSGGTIRGDSGTGIGTPLTTRSVTVLDSGRLAIQLGSGNTASRLNTSAFGSVLNLNSNAIIAPNGSFGAGDSIIALLASGNDGLIVAGITYDTNVTIATYTHAAGTGLQTFGGLQIDLTAISLSSGDQVTLSRSGDNLVLNFTPVPEPTLMLGLAAGLLGVGAFVKKRFVAVKA